MRVSPAQLPHDNWLHFLRLRDMAQIFDTVLYPLHGPVLEVGCGDGFLTTVLRARFKEVYPLDIQPRATVADLTIASGSQLPFPDHFFRFIFSSNVLEHIAALPAALAEFKRVLHPEGVMVHTMPTTTWKTLQFALRPLHLTFDILWPRLSGQPRPHAPQHSVIPAAGGTAAAQPSPGFTFEQRLKNLLDPGIHGVGRSHREEFQRFRETTWRQTFASHGWRVAHTAPLYLHSPYRLFPYRLLGMREALSRRGICSVIAYTLIPEKGNP